MTPEHAEAVVAEAGPHVEVAGGGGGGSAAPSASRGASAPLPKNYKVMISSKTVIKEGENEIKIDDLKVGDTVQVFSMKGGTKLDALEIVRTPKGNP